MRILDEQILRIFDSIREGYRNNCLHDKGFTPVMKNELSGKESSELPCCKNGIFF